MPQAARSGCDAVHKGRSVARGLPRSALREALVVGLGTGAILEIGRQQQCDGQAEEQGGHGTPGFGDAPAETGRITDAAKGARKG